jgi:hypothetical protein
MTVQQLAPEPHGRSVGAPPPGFDGPLAPRRPTLAQDPD